MYWDNLSDFLRMGTHGFYVLGSVLVMALSMLLEVFLTKRARQQQIARLQRQFRDENHEVSH